LTGKVPSCLIVGASRGLGLEMARQYAADGHRVIGTYRHAADGRLLAAACARALSADVLVDGWAASLGRELEGESLDLVIINAGVSGPQSNQPEAPDRDTFDAVMHTNVLASMQLIPVISDRLPAGGKLAVISSRMGSVGSASDASWWLYRASKAALNSVLKSASIGLGARGVVCMALHPGWVQTDMGGPGAQLRVPESVSSMRHVIAAANRSHNGRFLNYNGEQLEW
jgi:NAD(P)-dependent dehydrogenase (short-subunit alcohol dehydrogenase family)